MGKVKGGSVRRASGEEQSKPGRKRVSARVKRSEQMTGTTARKPSTRKTVGKADAAAEVDGGLEVPSGLEESTIDIKEIVRKARPEIIKKLVELAKKGSLQHIKVFLELYPEVGIDVDENEKQTLAELLLKELNGMGVQMADPEPCSG